ncbi:hypothetical protein [Microcoleus sp. B4-D4]|uniref:hypothetical protein n=1 Tax=Microcoleus sp. B4-D4 TaxID=2818667 RepID=UPI003FA5E9FA
MSGDTRFHPAAPLGTRALSVKTTSAPTIPSPLLRTKCALTITPEAAATGDTLHPAAIAPATKRTTAALS